MQALRQVFLDLDQRPLDGTLEALHPRRAMALDDDALQPQEARTIVPRRRQVGLQALEQWHGHGPGCPRQHAALEQLLDARTDHRRQPFTGLEQDVADEPVAHHHIGFAAIQPVTFDEAYVVEPAGVLQQAGRQLDLLVALDVFSTDVQ